MRDTDSLARSSRHKKKKCRSPSMASGEEAIVSDSDGNHSNDVERKRVHSSASSSSPERVRKHKKKKKKHKHKHKQYESNVEEVDDVIDLSPVPVEEPLRQRKSHSPSDSEHEHNGRKPKRSEAQCVDPESSEEFEREVNKRKEKRRGDEVDSYEAVRVKQEPVYEVDDRSRHIQSSSRHRSSDGRQRERPESADYHASRRYNRRETDRPRDGERPRENERTRDGERSREVERSRDGDRLRDNERSRDGERLRENERSRDGERPRENERSRDGDRQRQQERDHSANRRHNDDRSNNPRYEDRHETNSRHEPRERRGSEERGHQRSDGRPGRGRGGRGGTQGNRGRRNEPEETFEWGRKADNVKEEPIPPGEKEKPNFAPSGKLTEEANSFNGVVIKYSEPPEARKPRRRWRFYPFKGEKALQTLYIHRQSSYLIGRDRKIADIPVDHPSCSKQHAALQYRLVPFTRENGTTGKRVRPYIIDLESANGTFVNNNKIDAKKYVELLERDVVKFGFSSREYVLLHEHSKDDDYDDVGELDEAGDVAGDA